MPGPTKVSAASKLPPATKAVPHARTPKDDVNDSAEIRDYEIKIAQGHHPEYRPLHAALSLVQDTLYRPFARCDKQAIHFQKRYQLISIFAVVGGALTILLAILEFILPGKWCQAGELGLRLERRS